MKGERESERSGGRLRENERVIADDLVVSSTPRRIRRTSNSSADRYGFLVDSREGGFSRGTRGGRSGEEGGRKGERERGWVNTQKNEREAVVFVGCGGGWRTGTPRGCFHDDGNYRQGWLGVHEGTPRSPRRLSFSGPALLSLSFRDELLILQR